MDAAVEVKFRKSNRCWVVLAGCCLMSAVGFTVPITCWTVFITPLIKGLGINYTQASLYMTACTFAAMASMLFGARLIKMGAGKLIAISGCVCALGFILLAVAPSPAMIVVAGNIAGLAYPLTSLYTAPVIVKNWFYKNTHTFTGIALAFIGVGGVIFAPLTASLIASNGWQSAMIIIAIISIVVQGAIGIFMVRLDPIPLGILPYGASEEDILATTADGAAKKDMSKVPGLKFGESFKTPVAWLMLVVFLGLGVMATVTTNVNPMIQKFGFSAAQAAIALSCGSIGNITGKLIMGWASDKRGAEFGTLVGSLMAIVGFVGYILAFTVAGGSLITLYIAAFVCGNGCCMATMMPPLVGLDAFGPKDYDRIYGIFSAIRGAMVAVMSVMVGGMVDASGSYMSTIIFWIIGGIVMIPFAYIGIRAGRKRWSGNTKVQKSEKAAA